MVASCKLLDAGCPVAPDQLNIILEPFHRWKAAQGLGVMVADCCVTSSSFAEDVALVASPNAKEIVLVEAFLEQCKLLCLKVTKEQA